MAYVDGINPGSRAVEAIKKDMDVQSNEEWI